MSKNNVSPVTAGVVGAVIGAAVGAGAVALSDDKNQKMIKNKFNDLKKQGQKVYSDLQNKVEDLTSQGKDKVEEVKKDLKAKL